MTRFQIGIAAAIVGVATGVTPALAYKDIVGHVTSLTPTFIANETTSIGFNMDAGSALCPIGNQLIWVPGLLDPQAAYATLLAALLSRKQIDFTVNENLPQRCS